MLSVFEKPPKNKSMRRIIPGALVKGIWETSLDRSLHSEQGALPPPGPAIRTASCNAGELPPPCGSTAPLM